MQWRGQLNKRTCLLPFSTLPVSSIVSCICEERKKIRDEIGHSLAQHRRWKWRVCHDTVRQERNRTN